MDDLVEIGVVTRPHGVRGELRVHLHDPDSTVLFEVEKILLGHEEHLVAGARATTDAVLLRLAGVTDRNQAEALRGQAVLVAREDLGLAEDEVLLSDLVGCRVQRPDGSDYGQVVAVAPGKQDRIVIHQGDIERELPVVDAFIVDIDLEASLVVVEPPEDLPEWPRPA